MISTTDILLKGVNFRGKAVSEELPLSGYNISPRFLDGDSFIDFSSTTASQPSSLELDFFASIYHKYSSPDKIQKHLLSAKKKLSQILHISSNDFVFTPSGTDCDAIISIIAEKFNKHTHIINICPEETGRLTKRFQLLDIDNEDISVDGLPSFENSILKRFSRNQDNFTFHDLNFRRNNEDLNYKYLLDELNNLLETIPRNQIILLRAIFCSKTGLCFPSIKDLKIIKDRMSTNFHIVMDCCQSRITKNEFNDLREISSAMFFSFSKFLQTPSFAGISVFNNLIAELWKEMIRSPEKNNEMFPFVIDHDIYKYLSEIGAINSKLNASYGSILARCELGLKRLKDFWSLDESILQDRLSEFNLSVENQLGEIVKPIDIDFQSSISNSIRLLDFSFISISGKELYEILSRFYFKKRVILGQPVNLNGNSKNLRLSAGYRIICDPHYSKDLIEENINHVKKTFDSIFRII